jgi:hypothetical protein
VLVQDLQLLGQLVELLVPLHLDLVFLLLDQVFHLLLVVRKWQLRKELSKLCNNRSRSKLLVI